MTATKKQAGDGEEEEELGGCMVNTQSCKVAVIGAGAAGLVAARELAREGHRVVVYEESMAVGGVWVYDANVEDDPVGVHPNRRCVHSSMYASLRTNLPREVMSFLDYPFLPQKNGDERTFPGHQEVASYLHAFAEHFHLRQLVKFCTKVEYVGIYSDGDFMNDFESQQKFLTDCEEEFVDKEVRWIVRTRKGRQVMVKRSDELNSETEWEDELSDEIFDAVVICNGHYSQPKVARIPGIEKWPGKQMHSHNYRIADPFIDQVVVIIGNGPSGVDISLELTSVAKEVHLSAKKWDSDEGLLKPLYEGKLQRHLMVKCVSEDGVVTFEDGTSCNADVILHCTGYLYSFPFLNTRGIVSVEDNAVGPLYEHVFPPLLALSLSFVGLPFKVAPFPLFELQSKWIACALTKSSSLPSKRDMLAAAKSFQACLAEQGIPKHYTHCLDSYQFEYANWLASQCGSEPIENWRVQISKAAQQNRKLYPDSYRDL